MVTTGLQAKGMLVKLSIGQWSASKFDRKQSADLCKREGAAQAVARVRKTLIQCDSFKALRQHLTAARTWYYKVTLPWEDSGWRLLTAAQFNDFRAEEVRLKAEAARLVGVFVADYPGAVSAAAAAMGGLYQASDYPSAVDVGGRYTWECDIQPIPSGDDFRVDISQVESDRIRAEIEAKAQAAADNAARDLWQRLYDCVSHAVERLSTAKGVFRDTLVGNARELCDLLPRLNLTDDHRLEDMRQRVLSTLAGAKPQELRDNPAARAQAAAQAAAIQSDMSAIMGGAPAGTGGVK